MKKIKKYLFVCAEGIDRSPTAADVTLALGNMFKVKLKTAYMGITNGIIYENERGIDGKKNAKTYDKVFVMEKYMQRPMQNEYYVPKNKLTCLDIPNTYSRGEERLAKLLEEKLLSFILEA
jgi:predicted protein tyrosine phosphatase